MNSLHTLATYAQSGLIFMVVITVLVAVHELGHFWVARALGMHVDSFAVMMGGLRKTDLTPGLPRPMMASRLVAMVYVAAAALTAFAGIEGWAPLYLVGLAILTFVMPVWVCLRIGALYRMSAADSLGILGKTAAVALIILAFGTRMKGLTPDNIMAVLFFASLIGILIVYYQPVVHKPEDAPMGEGHLVIDGEERPVQFRPLLSRRDKHGTEYSFLLLPLGGFAAIKGMHPKPDGSETKIEQGFYSKSAFARFLVLFAGPLFSMLFGMILLVGLFTAVGVEEPVNEARIGAVLPGKPAERAGLKAGDRVLRVKGESVQTWFDIVSRVRDHGDQPLSLEVLRGKETLTIVATPEVDAQPSPVLGPDLEPTKELRKQAKLGAIMPSIPKPISVGEATKLAASMPLRIVISLAGVVKEPSRAKDELGGPAAIATQTRQAAEQGLGSVIFLAAMLSLSLGVMNLLPVPPLDGGQMVVAFVEMLRGGKRLSIQIQQTVQTVGMFLVAALFVSIIALDINRFIGK